MKKSFILFAALAALFSCSKENAVSPETSSQETYSFSLTALAPNHGVDVRTTLVGDGDNKLVHWTNGDAIKLLFFAHRGETNNYSKFTSDGQVLVSQSTEPTAEETKFKIEKWSTSGKKNIIDNRDFFKDMGIAVYPSTAIAWSEKYQEDWDSYFIRSEVSFVLPEEQTAVEGNFASGLNFSYAPIELDAFLGKKATQPVAFKNACALIRLTMPETLDKKVTSISLVSNSGGYLAGKGTVNLNAADNNISQFVVKEPFGVSISNGSGVTLSCVDGFVAGAQYYAVVWPGSHDGLTITFTAEDGTIATKTTGEVDLTSSSIKGYNIKSLEFGSGEDMVEPIQIGSFYYSDGTWSTKLKDGKTVLGVVFYVGDPHDKDDSFPNHCVNGMAVGLNQVSTQWNSSNIDGTDYKNYGLDQIRGLWGYESMLLWKQLYGNISLYSASYGEIDLEKTSGWYIPSVLDWELITNGNFATVNAKLSECGGTQLTTNWNTVYWLPVLYTRSNGNDDAYYIYFNASGTPDYSAKTGVASTKLGRPMFAF